ncbi:MAG: hypothetical protein JWR45_3480 [Blastococcus sp.]|jgi:hypothetical protein|nr:hypothetical protein [Blastococcus sp.]
MTVHDQRETVRTPTVPRPRTTADTPSDSAAGPVGEFPWPEPWHFSPGARPRSEFWDVETASWHSRGPIPAPRSSD